MMRGDLCLTLGCVLGLTALEVPATAFISLESSVPTISGSAGLLQSASCKLGRTSEGRTCRGSLRMTSSSLETSTTAEEYEVFLFENAKSIPYWRQGQGKAVCYVIRGTLRDSTLLRGVKVNRASDGEEIELLKAWEPARGKKTIVAFFTHTADFNSWEYAQRLRHYLPQIDDAGVGVVGVSLGTVDAARYFCAETGFPLNNMFMDATGAAYTTLGFSKGFKPQLPGDKKLNPYLRLLPMLAGIGSPGTIQAVLKGYTGDPSENSDWILSSLNIVDRKEFDVLGNRGSRPFELATLRLQNMRQIVTQWNKLSPPDKELITQQGGTIVFEESENIYSYKDKGILVYTNVVEMLKTIGVQI